MAVGSAGEDKESQREKDGKHCWDEEDTHEAACLGLRMRTAARRSVAGQSAARCVSIQLLAPLLLLLSLLLLLLLFLLLLSFDSFGVV